MTEASNEIRAGIKLSNLRVGARIVLLSQGQKERVEIIAEDEIESLGGENPKYTLSYLEKLLEEMPEEERKLNLLNNGICEL
jgi:hypothetical protein